MQLFEGTIPKKLELLAPSGSVQQLEMSINYGADAVYLGLSRFGARAKASFDIETLGEHIKYAHLFNVKVYAVVNTIIKASEMDDALSLIRQAHNLNVDAFIVQDIGLVKEIRRKMPQIELHASTQMGVHNVLGAQFAKDLGLKRVVLSREASLLDIIDIKKQVDIEVECFAHGALCVSFSGNCYFSSLVSGYSGNRGRCMQLCRKKYTVDFQNNKNEGYFISPKDICIVDEIEALRRAGVDSIKIEGRLRSPHYVAEAVRVYRKAIDARPITKEDNELLKMAYNRGDFSKGYLYNNDDILFPSVQGNIGCGVGTVVSTNPLCLSGGVALSAGDGLKFLRKGLEIGGGIVLKSGEIGTDARLEKGDEVRLTLSKQRQSALSEYKKRLQLEIDAEFFAGKPAKILLKCEGTSTVYFSEDVLEQAKNQPLSISDLQKGLSKLGATHFEIVYANIKTDEVFIAKSKLNQYRNEAIDLLVNSMLLKHEKPKIQDIASTMTDITQHNVCGGGMMIMLNDISQLSEWIMGVASHIIYSPLEYSVENVARFKNAVGDKFVLNLPIVCRKNDWGVLQNIIEKCDIKRVVSNNIYGLKLADYYSDIEIIAGLGHNLTNNSFGFKDYIQSIECERLPKHGAYIYAFGRFPLMNFTHCIKRQLGAGCGNCNGDVVYSDQTANKFSLRRIKIHDCYFQLVNQIPIFVKSASKNYKKNILLDFMGYTKEQIEDIYKQFIKGELSMKSTTGLIGKTLY